MKGFKNWFGFNSKYYHEINNLFFDFCQEHLMGIVDTYINGYRESIKIHSSLGRVESYYIAPGDQYIRINKGTSSEETFAEEDITESDPSYYSGPYQSIDREIRTSYDHYKSTLKSIYDERSIPHVVKTHFNNVHKLLSILLLKTGLKTEVKKNQPTVNFVLSSDITGSKSHKF